MSLRWMGGAPVLAAVAIAACGTAARSPMTEGVQPASAGEAVLTPAAQAKADSGRPPYTAADVRFMQGMIRHHAQAIVMADWAQTRAARSDIKILASRIDVAQRDEIALMQRWLRERREMAPEADVRHEMVGHTSLMPGMLTPAQLAQLEKATGSEFDRLFLIFMIQHHEGALTMVRELFASPGAGQDPTIFRFASDVEADQLTEIDRMHTMLGPQRNQL
jgi:uncharacterized protein (DUF305 family)